MTQKTRVLVADDSPFVCRLLTSYLHSAPDLEVVATAHDGREALHKVKVLRPDAVTLDLEMPEMDGLEALAYMMRECPTPVVAVSGVSGRAATRTLQALDLGAVDFVLKYAPGVHIDPAELCREILAKVRAASRIRVVRSLGSRTPASYSAATAAAARPRAESSGIVVVIGASTGGPLAVRELLSALPGGFGAGIVVVQHMPRSFTAVLAAQLGRHCRLRVREAEDGDRLDPGTVLVAPGGFHLLLRPGMRAAICAATVISGSSNYCPSIDAAMESAARVYGSRAMGVVLTGMGDDGALGLQTIHEMGGITFAQNAESCVVDGMPRRARERGAADHVAAPAQIAQLLVKELDRRASYAA